MAETSYAIALGSNRRHGRHGSPERLIVAALGALRDSGVKVLATSPTIRTSAWGPAGRSFANAAAIVASPLDPPELLALLKAIERAFGRRPGRRWGQRVLDLDILLWTEGRWPPFPRPAAPGRLSVPHRGLASRPFVLDPLLAIAPAWRDARSGFSIRQLHARLKRRRLVDPALHPQ